MRLTARRLKIVIHAPHELLAWRATPHRDPSHGRNPVLVTAPGAELGVQTLPGQLRDLPLLGDPQLDPFKHLGVHPGSLGNLIGSEPQGQAAHRQPLPAAPTRPVGLALGWRRLRGQILDQAIEGRGERPGEKERGSLLSMIGWQSVIGLLLFVTSAKR